MKWLTALVLIVACEPIDNGLMVRDGVELHQDAYPVTVDVVETEDLDVDLVDEAIEWWAVQAGIAVFERYSPGEATVEEGYVPCDAYDGHDECPSGVADVGYDEYGVIVDCDITLSSDIAYHRPTLLLVLEHELGHCLGLDDDPPSLDLGSIMSDPPVSGSGLTDHDRGLL